MKTQTKYTSHLQRNIHFQYVICIQLLNSWILTNSSSLASAFPYVSVKIGRFRQQKRGKCLSYSKINTFLRKSNGNWGNMPALAIPCRWIQKEHEDPSLTNDYWRYKFVNNISQSISDFFPVATFLITSVSCVSLFGMLFAHPPSGRQCVFSPTCVSSVSCSSPARLTWDPRGQSRYREPASLLRGSRRRKHPPKMSDEEN